MSGTTNIGDNSRTPHLAVIDGAAAKIDNSADQAYRTLKADVATAYSNNTATSATQERARVVSVAKTSESFQEALPSMVRAAGVPEGAAGAVAQAIWTNPDLRAKAQAAYDRIMDGKA